MKNFNHMIAVISEKIFSQSIDLKLIDYKDATTETVGIVFNNNNTTMTIIRKATSWCFTIKMKIKDNSNFIDNLKLYGFEFHPNNDNILREKLKPINKEKEAITTQLGLSVKYEVEQIFYFNEQDDLREQWTSCLHDINGTFLFIRAMDSPEGKITYEYLGYFGKDLIERTYDELPENEFCMIYLHLHFHEQGNPNICSEINSSNMKDYLKLLDMVKI